MKTLYLLRHAHTLDAPPPGKGDYERILSRKGAEEARTVGLFMKKNGLHPDFLLCSAAARAIQTAQLVTDALFGEDGKKIPRHFDRGLYHAPAEKILAEIRGQEASIHNLLVVVHNPGAAELAMQLGNIEHYAPATLTVFKAGCQDWSMFLPKAITLEKIFVPEVFL
jgi:phosphohistidine phosphatase